MLDAWQGQDGSDLRSDIKKYRQSIFKLNYKIKKSKTNCKARHKIAVPQNAADRVLAHQALDPSGEAARVGKGQRDKQPPCH